MSASGINEYENVSGGWLGVKIKDESRRSGFRGHGVPPDGRVILTEEERIATANAPRDPDNNPFKNGNLRLIAVDQQTAQNRPIGDGVPQPPREPEEAPEETQEAPGEAQSATNTPPEQKPEDEMTQAEIDAHNAKAAAARAIPTKEPPPPPASPVRGKPQPEQVATPEAVASAGKKPEGQRAAGEQVGTPGALKK